MTRADYLSPEEIIIHCNNSINQYITNNKNFKSIIESNINFEEERNIQSEGYDELKKISYINRIIMQNEIIANEYDILDYKALTERMENVDLYGCDYLNGELIIDAYILAKTSKEHYKRCLENEKERYFEDCRCNGLEPDNDESRWSTWYSYIDAEQEKINLCISKINEFDSAENDTKNFFINGAKIRSDIRSVLSELNTVNIAMLESTVGIDNCNLTNLENNCKIFNEQSEQVFYTITSRKIINGKEVIEISVDWNSVEETLKKIQMK